MMPLAELSDHADILRVFKSYSTQLPYIRADYLRRKIEARCVLWERGVVIISHQYKVTRLLSHVHIHKGEVMVSEVACQTPGMGLAKEVFLRFLAAHTTNVWLTVRTDNVRACRFYDGCGMQQVGHISWSNRTIPGFIYRWHPQNPLDKFVVVCDTAT